MEYKKKKNESRAHDQRRFIVIMGVLILVLLFGFGLVAYIAIAPQDDILFNETATHLGAATNPAVAELIEQTYEQSLKFP